MMPSTQFITGGANRIPHIRKNVAESGLDPETAPKVILLREKLAEAVDLDRTEIDVYNDLYRFFCRYYSDGDFISQRVYKEGVYAIPYEGEEVKLHWANSDQYYIKTGEYLRDYAFRLNGGEQRVHFRLVDATEGAHNNVKEANGKARLFALADGDFVAIENGELVIRFQYKPSPMKQEELLQQAAAAILANNGEYETWTAELAKPYIKSNGETADYSRLMHHLKKYAARNTFDYFIHKDLRSFLHRELDFFIKNEIMHLDDLEGATSRRVEQYLSRLKATRRIARKVIDFLAQLEEFQKRLWLKKKFVVETNYCITLDRVPKAFYAEIAANAAQREEWVRLFDYSVNTPALPGNLVLDTKFFGEDFKDKLIASIKNFDDQCDGLLIHSENFQALQFLQERYKEQVKCIYIDPPYNTDRDGFIFKDGYRHSSWMAMMQDRLETAYDVLSEDGVVFISIDDKEVKNLLQIVSPQSEIMIWRKSGDGRDGKMKNTTTFRIDHEYLIVDYKKDKTLKKSHEKPNWVNSYGNPDNDTRGAYKAGVISRTEEESKKNSENYYTVTSPSGAKFTRQFDVSYDEFVRLDKDGRIYWGKKGDAVPAIKVFEHEKRRVTTSSLLLHNGYTTEGTTELGEIVGDLSVATQVRPKPVKLLDGKIFVIGADDNSTILDYFAGSGTTGHAVINLNREDGGKRKYILVEMGDYFDTVLKPRIQKVIYAAEWKDGKPLNAGETPAFPERGHCFKYLRLESYEDTLANIAFSSSSILPGVKEEYMLRYCLEAESRESPVFLGTKAFLEPTDYQLKIKKPGSDESEITKIDLIETFNYLLGLVVETVGETHRFTADFKRYAEERLQLKGKIKSSPDGKWWFKAITGRTLDGQKILVLWRNRPGGETPDGMEEDNLILNAWFETVCDTAAAGEWDKIYVNGTNNLANLPTAADGNFRLIEEVFSLSMFE